MILASMEDEHFGSLFSGCAGADAFISRSTQGVFPFLSTNNKQLLILAILLSFLLLYHTVSMCVVPCWFLLFGMFFVWCVVVSSLCFLV